MRDYLSRQISIPSGAIKRLLVEAVVEVIHPDFNSFWCD